MLPIIVETEQLVLIAHPIKTTSSVSLGAAVFRAKGVKHLWNIVPSNFIYVLVSIGGWVRGGSGVDHWGWQYPPPPQSSPLVVARDAIAEGSMT